MAYKQKKYLKGGEGYKKFQFWNLQIHLFKTTVQDVKYYYHVLSA